MTPSGRSRNCRCRRDAAKVDLALAEMRAALSDRTDSAGRQRGAGLGLAIVRSFVSMHGGTISVERREPRGSRVVVSLPLQVAVAAPTASE